MSGRTGGSGQAASRGGNRKSPPIAPDTAAIDPRTRSALVNRDDGKLRRWDFVTNELTLTPGIGEACRPTLAGPDGVVHAGNHAILFAVGKDHARSRPRGPAPRFARARTRRESRPLMKNLRGGRLRVAMSRRSP